MPHTRDHRHQQRDQHVVAGEREAEEAPLHLVAADHLDGVEPLQQLAGAAEIDDRPGAIGRALPELPFDAGVIAAEPGIGERCEQQARQTRPARPAAAPRARRQTPPRSAERQGQIIGVALFEAERTGPDIQHELEEPGARQRRGRDGRNRQRRNGRRIGGKARRRRMGGGRCHGQSPEHRSMLKQATAVLSRHHGTVETRHNHIRAG